MSLSYDKQFTSLNISSSYYDDSQNYYKSTPRRSWWRWWKQRSRFQRALIYLFLFIILIIIVMIIQSSQSHTSKSNDKTDSQHSSGRLIPAATPVVQIENPQPIADNIESRNLNKQIPKPAQSPKKESKTTKSVKPTLSANYNNLKFDGPKNERQQQVVNAFKHAWNGYKKFAWGHDHLKPLTKTYQDWFGLGLTIIDSLDTMLIMDLKDEFQEARDFVANKLDLRVNKDVNLFETVIRVLGGLLGAYHLSGDKIFLKKATELGDSLLPAFKSPSGIPYSDINLYTQHAHAPKWGPDSSVSEVTTLHLEFKDLSRLTGDPKYEMAVDKVAEIVHNLSKTDGMVPIYINADTGRFRPFSTITLGARGDSYYEYLLKLWLQTGKTKDFLKKDYVDAIDGISKHLVKTSEPNKLVFVGELTSGSNFRPKMDHLACYFPSVLALGSHNGLSPDHLQLAKDIMYTCYQMYAQMPTFLAPEISHFNMIPGSDSDIFVKVNDAHNLLRPETIESLWYLYQLTGNKTYQDWGWQMFEAFEKYTKVESGGYTTIDNVKNIYDTRPRDFQESFFMAETLKYLYLLFSDDQTVMSLDKFVFNSEAHPLLIYNH
ncbi:hypothetical protein CHUAL_006146 [Chamberlinius hualienensis]